MAYIMVTDRHFKAELNPAIAGYWDTIVELNDSADACRTLQLGKPMATEAKSTGAMIADIILIGSAIVCLLVLSYFVYHYNWTGEREFT